MGMAGAVMTSPAASSERLRAKMLSGLPMSISEGRRLRPWFDAM